MSAENPEYWATGDEDGSQYNDIGELIEHMISDWDGPEPFPETLEVIGFDHDVINIDRLSARHLDDFLEYLDENYGPEDGTTITEAMLEATKEYITKMVGLYHVRTCHEVCRKTVNVCDYMDNPSEVDNAKR